MMRQESDSSPADGVCTIPAVCYRDSFTAEDTLLSCKEVLALTNLTKPGLYKLMNQQKFPRPIRIGERRVAWIQAEVLALFTARINERNGKANLKNG